MICKQIKTSRRALLEVIYLYDFKDSSADYTLISTSTPLGNSNFIKASTVLDEEE